MGSRKLGHGIVGRLGLGQYEQSRSSPCTRRRRDATAGFGDDLILRATSNGTTVMWFMNGATRDSTGNVNNPGTAWALTID